ncbi:MAG TPA: hypothetical protein VI306_22835 [Pyrinomonadaceae bacterium]
MATNNKKHEMSAAEVEHWRFINQWSVVEQSTDRTPAKEDFPGIQTPSINNRSAARRAHQLSYKRWSIERHD